jgi:hypothetical protein
MFRGILSDTCGSIAAAVFTHSLLPVNCTHTFATGRYGSTDLFLLDVLE